jgi:hypothetical protein
LGKVVFEGNRRWLNQNHYTEFIPMPNILMAMRS